MQPVEVWPGTNHPLGATWNGSGVNFALFSESAEGVELVLYDVDAIEERVRIAVTEQTDGVWHCYLPEARPGQGYGYRVHGPYEPKKGLRFNANKLLLDPYARALSGTLQWSDELFGYEIGHSDADLSFDSRDSAADTLKGIIVDPAFTWGSDQSPDIPWHETIIYEAHVRGMTMRHPAVEEKLRGTYEGLATPAVIDHLLKLGVTSVELMPVHHSISDRHLQEAGLSNYWGYNSIGFFAPDSRYASVRGQEIAGSQVHEFKSMVKAFHDAGLEVILDVVYNHTAEGNHLGPTLSFRGIDNASYYRLSPDSPRHYYDFTGCGNSLNMTHPRVLQLIMDSLRYWIRDMHVDGFRFDLASTLARELHEVDRLGAFFDIVRQDPLISQVKLIAEPWDLGEGGYQVGNFPSGWAEWNGRYRDAIRDYWRGGDRVLGELGLRLTGSPDLYSSSGRLPHASVNFITAHDGFTLNDLVSYNEKHNDKNPSGHEGGEDHNRSWNCGAEGPTGDKEINGLRLRQKRNFLTTLFLSQGIPMLLAGDEFGHTQQGNNNAYCQDNELTWLDWNNKDDDLFRFTSRLIRFRKEHQIFQRRRWFQGRSVRGRGVDDIVWLRADANLMSDEDWDVSFARSVAILLNGDAIASKDRRGARVRDSTYYLMFNGHYEALAFTLPSAQYGKRWRQVFDTASGKFEGRRKISRPGEETSLEARSVRVLQRIG